MFEDWGGGIVGPRVGIKGCAIGFKEVPGLIRGGDETLEGFGEEGTGFLQNREEKETQGLGSGSLKTNVGMVTGAREIFGISWFGTRTDKDTCGEDWTRGLRVDERDVGVRMEDTVT